MIFHRLKSIKNGQKGFTLIEMVAALSVTAIIGLGVAMTTFQVVDLGAENGDYTTASRHTLNAIHWIGRDAQMAQTLETNGTSGFPLVIGWEEWDNTIHQITYTAVGDTLKRSYSVDGGAPSETLVAQYINFTSDNSTCELSGDVLTIKITATVGSGLNAVSATKIREIIPRPSI